MNEQPIGQGPRRVPETIVCVECGGPCGLLTRYEDGYEPEPGDIVAYRCAHCLDRWDVELAWDDDGE